MKLDQRIKIVHTLILLALIIFAGRMLMPKLAPSPYTSLMNAIESGDVSTVKAELNKGTDPNQLPPAQDEPVAPLCAASANGKVEIVRLLLARGADVHSGDGWDATPLEAAATNNQIQVMQLLIAHGAIVNDFGNGSSYALWRAAVEGKTEAVKFLLAHGAKPNTTDYNGQTLLSVVESFNQKRVAVLLRQAGAK